MVFLRIFNLLGENLGSSIESKDDNDSVDIIRRAVMHKIDSNRILEELSQKYQNKIRKYSSGRNSEQIGINLKENKRENFHHQSY